MTRIDYNLIGIVHTVMVERNVTRAAAALGMSQPSVSNALTRARRQFGDQLFFKVPSGVEPTPRLLELWPQLKAGIGGLDSLLASQAFDPLRTTATYRLAVTDSLSGHVVPTLLTQMDKTAPMARFVFEQHTNEASLTALASGHLHCAVGMFPNLPASLGVRGLFSEPFVCLMSARNPLATKLCLEDFVGARHVLVTPSANERGVVDTWLTLKGHKRNIVAVVNHFSEAADLVTRTGLLACVPRSTALNAASRDVAWCPLPWEAEEIMYKLVWHERYEADQAHRWFRDCVTETCLASFEIPTLV